MKTLQITPVRCPAHPIDRKIFGSFIEHAENCIQEGIMDEGNPLSDANGIRQDVLHLCRELGPSLLRFPGGTVVGTYHWEDHVGPANQRKILPNLVWGGMMTANFGTCEFVSFCRQVGAEPMLCVNMPSGTPEEAAHWVEYCNGNGNSYYANLRRSHGHEEPFHVRYWCIGNESFSVPDLGMQDHVGTYIRQAWEYTKYMKMADPEIELIFVGNPCDMQWNQAVMESLWEVCDYLSVHYYTHSREAFRNLKEFDTQILELRAMISEFNSRTVCLDRWYRIPPRQHETWIALDEWNIWDGEADEKSLFGLQQRYTWQDALWTACFLNRMIRNGDLFRIGNMAQMVNVLAPVIAEKDAAWKQTIFTPFSLYAHGCGTRYLPCLAEQDENMDTVLTSSENGRRLFFVNRGQEPVTVKLPFPADRIVVFTAGSPQDVCSRDRDCVVRQDIPLSSVREVCIPGWSLSCICIP